MPDKKAKEPESQNRFLIKQDDRTKFPVDGKWIKLQSLDAIDVILTLCKPGWMVGWVS